MLATSLHSMQIWWTAPLTFSIRVIYSVVKQAQTDNMTFLCVPLVSSPKMIRNNGWVLFWVWPLSKLQTHLITGLSHGQKPRQKTCTVLWNNQVVKFIKEIKLVCRDLLLRNPHSPFFPSNQIYCPIKTGPRTFPNADPAGGPVWGQLACRDLNGDN